MLLLILAYPLLAHWAQMEGGDFAMWVALMVPIAVLLLSPRWRSPWTCAAAGALGAAALGFIQAGAGEYLPFLPAVLIPLLLLVIFSRDLTGTGPCLVTRIATAVDGELPPQAVAYTRRVNYLWCGFFALMALANLLIAWLAVHERWALSIDCLDYAAVGLVFAGEYVFRRARFPHAGQRSFPDYLRRVARVDYRQLMR